MNKRFKRYQKLLAVSLAAMSCAEINTSGFSLIKKFESMIDTIKKRFSRKTKQPIEDISMPSGPIILNSAKENLFAKIQNKGLVYSKPQDKKELEGLLKNYALELKNRDDNELYDLLTACDDDVDTLKLVLLERGINKQSLESEATKKLFEHVPNVEIQKFAQNVRELVPQGKPNKDDINALKADLPRHVKNKIARLWMEWLQIPVSEGRVVYCQGLGYLLESYFGPEHKPSANDAEAVVKIAKFYAAMVEGNQYAMKIFKEYVEKFDYRQLVRFTAILDLLTKETNLKTDGLDDLKADAPLTIEKIKDKMKNSDDISKVQAKLAESAMEILRVASVRMLYDCEPLTTTIRDTIDELMNENVTDTKKIADQFAYRIMVKLMELEHITIKKDLIIK